MSDSFKQREKSYEAKYKMDQELAFKVSARRNKLLGLWLAKKAVHLGTRFLFLDTDITHLGITHHLNPLRSFQRAHPFRAKRFP